MFTKFACNYSITQFSTFYNQLISKHFTQHLMELFVFMFLIFSDLFVQLSYPITAHWQNGIALKTENTDQTLKLHTFGWCPEAALTQMANLKWVRTDLKTLVISSKSVTSTSTYRHLYFLKHQTSKSNLPTFNASNIASEESSKSSQVNW